jgi:hypothetical protein
MGRVSGRKGLRLFRVKRILMEFLKIVVRFADGRMLKGYTQDFSPKKPIFHFFRSLGKGSSSHREIRVSDLKAIFFVKTFSGNAQYKERKGFVEGQRAQGRKAEVAFADGEIMLGSVLGYNAKDSGFFLFPSDPKSNNDKVFVVNNAVKGFRYLEDDSAQKRRASEYQGLIPETAGKLFMATDEERAVIRLVLEKVLKTDNGRGYIVDKLGVAYLLIAEDLLKAMGSN